MKVKCCHCNICQTESALARITVALHPSSTLTKHYKAQIRKELAALARDPKEETPCPR